MKYLDYKILAFAFMLICLLCFFPAPAKQNTGNGDWLALEITASGSNIAEHAVKLKVREGEVTNLKWRHSDKEQYQYLIHAHRPKVDYLPMAARKVQQPLVISIRIDRSEDGQVWQLQTQANLTASIGTTVSAEFSDVDKSTQLIVSSQLLAAAEHS